MLLLDFVNNELYFLIILPFGETTDTQTGGNTDRQTGRQRGGQINRQIDG